MEHFMEYFMKEYIYQILSLPFLISAINTFCIAYWKHRILSHSLSGISVSLGHGSKLAGDCVEVE